MKISYFTDTYEPQINGVVTSINLFTEQLEKNGNEVHIFCPRDKKMRKRKFIHSLRSFEFKGYPSYRVGVPNPKVLAMAKKVNPDLIHIQTPILIGFAGLAIAKRLRTPIVMTYHTMYTDYIEYLPGSNNRIGKKLNKETVNNLTKWFFNKADIIIAPSQETMRFLRKLGVKREIVVLPTGIKIKNSKYSKKKNKKPIILHVGRVCKEKYIDILIKAFQKLRKRMDAELVITSSGPAEKELKELARKLGLEKSVRFTGFISEDEKNKWYKKADLFATASTTDTQGIVILEAMDYGTPVIAANAGGFRDYVKNNYNGFLFNPKNTNEFADKMKKVLKNEKLKERLGKNGYEYVKTLSIEKCTKKLGDIYNEFFGKQKVSVIIPTFMEEKYIEKTLKSVRNQSYRNFEIIVVDSNSSDKTTEIARKYAGKVIVTKERGIGMARNLGARKSNGDILLFLDADTCLQRDFIRNIIRKYRKKNVVCACGYVKSYGSFANRLIYSLLSETAWILSMLGKPAFYGMCMSLKREAFDKIGGFNEALATAEDIDITKRARKLGKCVMVREAVSTTSPRRVVGMGRLKAVSFHIRNFLSFKAFRKFYDFYTVERMG